MELTNIEYLVFTQDDGSEIEMQIVDEFEYEGGSYIALVNAAVEDGDEISVYKVSGDDEYEQVEENALLNMLLDIVEERIAAKYLS